VRMNSFNGWDLRFELLGRECALSNKKLMGGVESFALITDQ
jgi:hypothetical protein